MQWQRRIQTGYALDPGSTRQSDRRSRPDRNLYGPGCRNRTADLPMAEKWIKYFGSQLLELYDSTCNHSG